MIEIERLFDQLYTAKYAWNFLNYFLLSFDTQPDGTLIFLIFTYLRGRSYWNSRDYGSNTALCHFLKPETNTGDFRIYFELIEKSCRGRHHFNFDDFVKFVPFWGSISAKT